MSTNLWLFPPELCAAHSLPEKVPRERKTLCFHCFFGWDTNFNISIPKLHVLPKKCIWWSFFSPINSNTWKTWNKEIIRSKLCFRDTNAIFTLNRWTTAINSLKLQICTVYTVSLYTSIVFLHCIRSPRGRYWEIHPHSGEISSLLPSGYPSMYLLTELTGEHWQC